MLHTSLTQITHGVLLHNHNFDSNTVFAQLRSRGYINLVSVRSDEELLASCMYKYIPYDYPGLMRLSIVIFIQDPGDDSQLHIFMYTNFVHLQV